jgi:hypothetical protein
LKIAAAINAKGEPFPAELLITALMFSQHKMIDRLIKRISKQEPLDNKNKGIKESEEVLGRESTHDYIRMMEEFIILMIISRRYYMTIYEFYNE